MTGKHSDRLKVRQTEKHIAKLAERKKGNLKDTDRHTGRKKATQRKR